MMKNASKLLCFVLLLSVISSCNDTLDTPTSGDIKIGVDESFSLFMDSEVAVFQGLYSNAKIAPRYVSEKEAIKALLDDSVTLAVVSRDLTAEEKKYFEGIKLTPRVTKIATDAIALIVNPSNTDSIFTMPQLADLFSGKVQAWKDFDSKSGLSNIQVVFDNQGSSTARYIKEKFSVKDFAANVSAVKSNAEVVNYVASHKDAIGVIGVNWISDTEDTMSKDFLSKIQVVRIVTDSTGPNGRQPYQAYIAQKIYPLTRDVYIISREARGGLGTGFASFVAGDKGQRIILKSGLMPATQPIRIINVN